MHGPYGLNNIAEQRHQDARLAAHRDRLAGEAQAGRFQTSVRDPAGLRRLAGQAAVAIRWAVRAVLG
jgi:hypothetical protein